ncbi:MAG: hypothetical protein ACFFED_09440 [Candidatus Thorarchaeota archaeon]
MGWRIRATIVGLTALMLALLIITVVSLVSPELENIALFFVATFGVNLFIGIFALFKVGGRRS